MTTTSKCRKKRKTRLLVSTPFEEGLTPEQQKKFYIERENVDFAGLMKRNRIKDQTIFDVLLIEFLIEQPQHEAAYCFVDLLGQSGAVIRSPDFSSPLSTVPAHEIGDQIAQRHMAFSGAYRRMAKEAGDEDADFCIRVSNNIYFHKKDRGFLEEVGLRVERPLWSLAKYFGTTSRRDPRRVLRAQLGSRSL